MVDAKGDREQLLYTTSRVTVGAAFLHHPIVIILFFVDTFATTIIIRVSDHGYGIYGSPSRHSETF